MIWHLGSVAKSSTYSIPPIPPVLAMFWILISPSNPELSPIASPIFHPLMPLLSIIFFHPLLPPLTPNFTWARYNSPPGRRPHLLASIDCLRFPPMLGGPINSLYEPVTPFPHTVAPPLPYLTFSQIPVRPRGSPLPGSLPHSDCLHHLHY